MELIETVTLGSGGAASITFSAISGDFTDLVLVYSLRATHASVTSYQTLSFNGSTASFSIRGLGGNGTSTFSYTTPANFGGEVVGNNATANTFANGSIYIPNYTSSVNKSFSIDSVGENNGTQAQQAIVAGLRSNTDPISSVTLTPLSGNYMQYSSASLYGITAGTDGVTTVS